MARGENSSRYSALHSYWQFQQSQGVGNLGTGPTQSRGKFLLRATKVRKQLRVSGRFFKRVELHSMQVLQKCVTQQFIIGSSPNDCRNSLETSFSTRSPAPLTRDEFVAIPHRAYDYRLKETHFFDGKHKFCEGLFVEDLPGLLGIGNNRVEGEFGVCR
jgi:hypothetical protein